MAEDPPKQYGAHSPNLFLPGHRSYFYHETRNENLRVSIVNLPAKTLKFWVLTSPPFPYAIRNQYLFGTDTNVNLVGITGFMYWLLGKL